MKRNLLLWTEVSMSGIVMPVYCTKLKGAYGMFRPRELDILIHYKQSNRSACLTLLHECVHARLYMDDHTSYQGEDAERMCDWGARFALEAYGAPPRNWLTTWDIVRDEYESRVKRSDTVSKDQS